MLNHQLCQSVLCSRNRCFFFLSTKTTKTPFYTLCTQLTSDIHNFITLKNQQKQQNQQKRRPLFAPCFSKHVNNHLSQQNGSDGSNKICLFTASFTVITDFPLNSFFLHNHFTQNKHAIHLKRNFSNQIQLSLMFPFE